MISVIMSSYNREKRIKKSIESVLNQSFKDFELIIVDDCSTDKTFEIAKEFEKKDKRVRAIQLPSNSGHDGKPKNVGILNATGNYIVFLDDDDEMLQDALKILERYARHTNADVVYGDYFIDDKGKSATGWSLNFSLQNLVRFNFIAVGTAITKKDVLLKIGGFDEEVPRFKDWNLWIRAAKNGASFVHIPIPVYRIYAHEESISCKYGKQTELDENGSYKPTFFNPADCKIYPDKTVMGDRKPLKVAIYTMTLNRLEYTKKMYESLSLGDYDFDWFVLDQNSTDGTKEWLKGKCDLIEEKENIGVAKGWDKLIKRIKEVGGYDIVVKVDNHAEMMTKGWLKEMVYIFERNRMVILSPYVEGLEDSPGGVMRQRPDGESPYVLINDKVMGMVPNLGGIVFATPLKLYDNFSFPEGIQGNKDYYLSQYARSLGYNLMYMEEFRVWHIDGTAGQKIKYKDYFKMYEN